MPRSVSKCVSRLPGAAATALQVLEYLRDVSDAYNGFNLIFSDGRGLAVYESVRGAGRVLGAGIYGLSNHLLDTPWPKVEDGAPRSRRDHAPAPSADATARDSFTMISSSSVSSALYGGARISVSPSVPSTLPEQG